MDLEAQLASHRLKARILDQHQLLGVATLDQVLDEVAQLHFTSGVAAFRQDVEYLPLDYSTSSGVCDRRQSVASRRALSRLVSVRASAPKPPRSMVKMLLILSK